MTLRQCSKLTNSCDRGRRRRSAIVCAAPGPSPRAPAAHAQVRAHVLALAAAISISRLTFQPRALSTLSACSLTRSNSLRASSEFGIFLIASTFADRVVVQGAALGHRLRALCADGFSVA